MINKIVEYLRLNREINDRAMKEIEAKKNYSFLKNIIDAFDSNMEFIPVFSTRVYPEIISYENINYLIWDEHIITILYTYFECLGLILLDEDDEIRISETSQNICSRIFSYLACKSQDPHLAVYFANVSRQMFGNYNYENLKRNKDINHLVISFKYLTPMYILYHELAHLSYKNDQKFNKLDKKAVLDKVDWIKNSESFLKKIILEGEENNLELAKIKEIEILEYIESINHDDNEVEEIICDLNASLNTLEIYNATGGKSDKYKDFVVDLWITSELVYMVGNTLYTHKTLSKFYEYVQTKKESANLNYSRILKTYRHQLVYWLFIIINLVEFENGYDEFERVKKQFPDITLAIDKYRDTYANVYINEIQAFLDKPMTDLIWGLPIDKWRKEMDETECLTQFKRLLGWDILN